MKAIIMDAHGNLSLQKTKREELGAHDVCVRVHAVGVNRADLMQRAGRYRAPKGTRADILGLEFAGEIHQVGHKVSQWVSGERVMGLVPGASYAQEIVIHERLLLPIPNGMHFSDAACIPEVFLTAFDALFCQLALERGDRVLVHAIGSGVGDALYQLARVWGIHIIGTTRSAWKIAPYTGLAQGIVVENQSFLPKLTSRVDAVIDFVGGGYLEENLRALQPGGKMLLLGLLGGVQDTCPLGLILVKRLQVMGATLRARRFEEKLALLSQFQKRALPLFTQGILVPTKDKVFAWTEVEAAHHYLSTNQNRGKIILQVEP